MDERLFLSTDNIAANHSYDIGKSNTYKKWGSLDANNNQNNLESFIEKGIESRKIFNDQRCKIKSNKDLRKRLEGRNQEAKSKSKNKNKNKVWLEYLENKEDIKKYMK